MPTDVTTEETHDTTTDVMTTKATPIKKTTKLTEFTTTRKHMPTTSGKIYTETTETVDDTTKMVYVKTSMGSQVTMTTGMKDEKATQSVTETTKSEYGYLRETINVIVETFRKSCLPCNVIRSFAGTVEQLIRHVVKYEELVKNVVRNYILALAIVFKYLSYL